MAEDVKLPEGATGRVFDIDDAGDAHIKFFDSKLDDHSFFKDNTNRDHWPFSLWVVKSNFDKLQALPDPDGAALRALWGRNAPTEPVCSWTEYGHGEIECDNESRVVKVRLKAQPVTGEPPATAGARELPFFLLLGPCRRSSSPPAWACLRRTGHFWRSAFTVL